MRKEAPGTPRLPKIALGIFVARSLVSVNPICLSERSSAHSKWCKGSLVHCVYQKWPWETLWPDRWYQLTVPVSAIASQLTRSGEREVGTQRLPKIGKKNAWYTSFTRNGKRGDWYTSFTKNGKKGRVVHLVYQKRKKETCGTPCLPKMGERGVWYTSITKDEKRDVWYT